MVTDELAARNVEIVSRGQRETVDVLGIWCEWKTTEAETNHHYSVMEMIVPPGAGVPLHRHAIQETFTVLDGSAEFGRLGENGEEWRPIATRGCRERAELGLPRVSQFRQRARANPTYVRRRAGGLFPRVWDSSRAGDNAERRAAIGRRNRTRCDNSGKARELFLRRSSIAKSPCAVSD